MPILLPSKTLPLFFMLTFYPSCKFEISLSKIPIDGYSYKKELEKPRPKSDLSSTASLSRTEFEEKFGAPDMCNRILDDIWICRYHSLGEQIVEALFCPIGVVEEAYRYTVSYRNTKIEQMIIVPDHARLKSTELQVLGLPLTPPDEFNTNSRTDRWELIWRHYSNTHNIRLYTNRNLDAIEHIQVDVTGNFDWPNCRVLDHPCSLLEGVLTELEQVGISPVIY